MELKSSSASSGRIIRAKKLQLQLRFLFRLVHPCHYIWPQWTRKHMFLLIWSKRIFTELALQSTSCNVHLCVCLCAPSQNTQFLVTWRLLVGGHIANICLQSHNYSFIFSVSITFCVPQLFWGFFGILNQPNVDQPSVNQPTVDTGGVSRWRVCCCGCRR